MSSLVSKSITLTEAARRITSDFQTRGFWGGLEFKFVWEREAFDFASLITTMGYSYKLVASVYSGYIVSVFVSEPTETD